MILVLHFLGIAFGPNVNPRVRYFHHQISYAWNSAEIARTSHEAMSQHMYNMISIVGIEK